MRNCHFNELNHMPSTPKGVGGVKPKADAITSCAAYTMPTTRQGIAGWGKG